MSSTNNKRAGQPDSTSMHCGPGFRIRKDFERAEQDLIEQFKQFASPDISDLMNRLYTMSSDIQNLSNEETICGSACTVKLFPGDNLMVHKALDIVKPGDVVVIDTSENYSNAVLGDIISNKAKHKGIAGFVIDGLVRDIKGIRETGLPVFACGISPVGPLHRGPGELNYSISCGGIVVNPGDIIRGDDSGIVVVRREFAPDILQRMYDQRERLKDYIAEVKKGNFDNSWVDRTLAQGNCQAD